MSQYERELHDCLGVLLGAPPPEQSYERFLEGWLLARVRRGSISIGDEVPLAE